MIEKYPRCWGMGGEGRWVRGGEGTNKFQPGSWEEGLLEERVIELGLGRIRKGWGSSTSQDLDMAKQALIQQWKTSVSSLWLEHRMGWGGGRTDMELINPVCFSNRKLAHKQSKYKGLFVPENMAKYMVYWWPRRRSWDVPVQLNLSVPLHSDFLILSHRKKTVNHRDFSSTFEIFHEKKKLKALVHI